MIKLFRRILNLSGKHRGKIQTSFGCAFFESVLAKMSLILAFYVLTGFYQNTLTADQCLKIGVALTASVTLQAVFYFFRERLQSVAGYHMFAEKRMALGRHLKNLPMGYFTAGNSGKISSVLSTDMIFIEEVAMSTIASMMNYLFSALILLVFMFMMDWRLGLAASAVTLCAHFTARRMNRISLREAAQRQNQSEMLTDAVLSFAEGIEVIKSYNLTGAKLTELSDNFKRSKDTSIAFEGTMTPWTTGLNILYGVGAAVILGLSVWLQLKGLLSVPYLLGLLLFVFELFGPLKALYGEATRLTVMNASLDRIEEVLSEPELPDTGIKDIPACNPDELEIDFRNVGFAYDKRDVLKGISFQMKKNTMTALVGPSGSGKTTVANLLSRFWDVNEGSIMVRGTDIREIPIAALMEHISMVFQRVYLFQDTIYHNISMGKPEASPEEVYEAARKARCYDFILALPKGFQTIIGEGGATLSGGEKQRISIARCILKDAQVVILDEATASVDTDNESYIQEAISELVKGKTLLVIAHRLNTIRSADQILVLADGQVTERGTHSQLVNRGGMYAEFVNISERTTGWRI